MRVARMVLMAALALLVSDKALLPAAADDSHLEYVHKQPHRTHGTSAAGAATRMQSRITGRASAVTMGISGCCPTSTWSGARLAVHASEHASRLPSRPTLSLPQGYPPGQHGPHAPSHAPPDAPETESDGGFHR